MTVMTPAVASHREVDVAAADGVKLRGTYYDPQEPGPGVIFFHQCSRERRLWEPLATKLSDYGAHVLVLSPRGTEDSQGAVWDYDGSLKHALEYWRKNWAGDAESGYQWLKAQTGVDSHNIVAMGAGCGSFLALLTAQRHYPAVRNAVFFSDFVDEETRKFLHESPQLAMFSAVSEQDPMSLDGAKEIHAISHHDANRLLSFPAHAHGIGLLEKYPEVENAAAVWVETQLERAADPRVDEIIRIHELDRADHMRGDADDLASRHAADFVSVAGGKTTHQTREEALAHMREYFGSRTHKAWEDVEAPVVRVSPRGDMAWAIYRVHSRYTEKKQDGTQQDGEFVCAWTSTYEKRDGKWLMTSVTSTFEGKR
jgi:dienelactone hydrolase